MRWLHTGRVGCADREARELHMPRRACHHGVRRLGPLPAVAPGCPSADLGPAWRVLRPADEQVGRLLASLNINPLELPAEALAQAPNFEHIFAAAAPRLAQPSAVGEHAAAAAMAAAAQQRQGHAAPHEAQWAQEFERLRLGEAGPSGSGSWATDFQQQQQQQQGTAGWADEFQAPQAEAATAGDSAGWVDEFRSTAAAGAAMRQRAAEGDAIEQTRRLADTLACEGGWWWCFVWWGEGGGLKCQSTSRAASLQPQAQRLHARTTRSFPSRRACMCEHHALFSLFSFTWLAPPKLSPAAPHPATTACPAPGPAPQPAPTPRYAAPSSCSLCPR